MSFRPCTYQEPRVWEAWLCLNTHKKLRREMEHSDVPPDAFRHRGVKVNVGQTSGKTDWEFHLLSRCSYVLPRWFNLILSHWYQNSWPISNYCSPPLPELFIWSYSVLPSPCLLFYLIINALNGAEAASHTSEQGALNEHSRAWKTRGSFNPIHRDSRDQELLSHFEVSWS